MLTYLIEVTAEERRELARLVKADYYSTKRTFGALPVGSDLMGEAEQLHQKIVTAIPKES